MVDNKKTRNLIIIASIVCVAILIPCIYFAYTKLSSAETTETTTKTTDKVVTTTPAQAGQAMPSSQTVVTQTTTTVSGSAQLSGQQLVASLPEQARVPAQKLFDDMSFLFENPDYKEVEWCKVASKHYQAIKRPLIEWCSTNGYFTTHYNAAGGPKRDSFESVVHAHRQKKSSSSTTTPKALDVKATEVAIDVFKYNAEKYFSAYNLAHPGKSFDMDALVNLSKNLTPKTFFARDLTYPLSCIDLVKQPDGSMQIAPYCFQKGIFSLTDASILHRYFIGPLSYVIETFCNFLKVLWAMIRHSWLPVADGFKTFTGGYVDLTSLTL